MATTVFYDVFSTHIDDFLRARGSEAVKSPISEFRDLGLRLDDDPAAIQSDMAVLQAKLTSLVGPHAWVKLLMTFRRIPLNLLQERDAPVGSTSDSLSSAPIQNYATSFGTNLIVSCALPSDELVDRRSIFSMPPTETEIEVAIAVFVWSSFHGFMQYRLNTKSREAISPGNPTGDLIHSYNLRHANRYEDKTVLPEALDGMILTTAPARSFSSDIRNIRVHGANGAEYVINHRNYVPYPVHLDRLEPLYKHLEGETFRAKFGLSYAKWFLIYRGLNACLFASIATLWGTELKRQVTQDGQLASVERADDLGQSALGIANLDSLVDWVTRYAATRHRTPKISADDVNLFIHAHTTPNGAPLDPFVERTDCFYRLSDTVAIWDYIRSAALLPVVRRQMAPLLGAAGQSKAKGRTFEALVKNEIKSHLPHVRALSGSKKRRENGKDLFELDVGFVLDQVLFVIDAKYVVKPKRYMTGDPNKVLKRSDKSLEMLDYLDQQIARHLDWLKSEWAGVEVTEVIGIICTAEVEYISTIDSSAWLVPLQVPRVCTISELTDFLKRPDWHERVSRCPSTQVLRI